MKRRPVLVLVAAFLGASACVAFDYGKALDQCAFDHVGDPAGRAQCQCDVSKEAGRSCAWLGDAGLDGGAQ